MADVRDSASGKPRIAILVGSPHAGATERLADLLGSGVAEAGGLPDVFRVREHAISGCTGCGACMADGSCVISDDMDGLLNILDGCDGLMVVTPVYFASAPSQLKAVLDRFQPRWVRRYVLGIPARAKRPALLVVTGSGGDPYGYQPLVTTARSALAIAGFRLQGVEDFIGYGGLSVDGPTSENRTSGDRASGDRTSGDRTSGDQTSQTLRRDADLRAIQIGARFVEMLGSEEDGGGRG